MSLCFSYTPAPVPHPTSHLIPNLTPQPTPRDLRMMRLALGQADRAGAMGEVPVGAVVYRHHLDADADADAETIAQPIAAAHNRREVDGDPTAHAEVLAIRDAAAAVGGWRLTGLTLCVTLEPCPMCAGALVNARLSRLVYAAADPKMGCIDTLHHLASDPRFNHRVEVISGVLAEESAAMLRAFFSRLRLQKEPRTK